MDRNLQSLLNSVNEPNSSLCKLFAEQSLNDMREVLNDMQSFLTSGVDKGYFRLRENGDYGLDKVGLALYVDQKIRHEDNETDATVTKSDTHFEQKHVLNAPMHATKLEASRQLSNKISSKADALPLKYNASEHHNNNVPKVSSFKAYQVKGLPTNKRAKTNGKQKTNMLKRFLSLPTLRKLH